MLVGISKVPPFRQTWTQDSSEIKSEYKSASINDKIINLNGAKALRSLAFSNITFRGVNQGLFREVRACENNPKWQSFITRLSALYKKPNDLRSEFTRDFHRIVYTENFRTLKGKTQVDLIKTDHICTRGEHVELVSYIARDISKALGLNEELAEAIAMGHDIGHTPFGHEGERCLKALMKSHNIDNGNFWHERNGLRVVDKIATVEGIDGSQRNLNLTYAVRDGIIFHCGEVDQNGLRPRSEILDLSSVTERGKYEPYSWEGCVVKISDKIAYLGRDLEDALNTGSLSKENYVLLQKKCENILGKEIPALNQSFLIDHFVYDLVKHSNPNDGLRFSEETLKLMSFLRTYNTEKIYLPVNSSYHDHTLAVFNSIFDNLHELYNDGNPLPILKEKKQCYPKLASTFSNYLDKYSDINPIRSKKHANEVIYSIKNKDAYKRAIVDFIAGMTDKFATDCHEEVTGHS